MLGPTLQTRWDWRAAGNFIFGGTGTGLMIMAATMSLLGHSNTFFGLVASLFVGAGLGLVWLEIGRPMRSLNVFKNPNTSWMTREGMIAIAVLPLGMLAMLIDSAPVLIAAAVFAFGFMFAQAQILRAAKGIPAWRAYQIIALICTTGLAEGAGIFLIGTALSGAPIPDLAWIITITLIGLRILAWEHYRSALRRGAPEGTLKALRSISIPFHLIGLFIPFITAMVAVLNDVYQFPLAIITGLCITFSGWFCKYTIIIHAAYSQGYAIPHTPARGGGTSGPGIQPGWRLKS